MEDALEMMENVTIQTNGNGLEFGPSRALDIPRMKAYLVTGQS
jgi:hypothetical protein